MGRSLNRDRRCYPKYLMNFGFAALYLPSLQRQAPDWQNPGRRSHKPNELALRNSASLAALAWSRLEQAAQETLKANGSVPALQLFANADGITAKIEDRFGTSIIIQDGKISARVSTPAE
jgi:hypothetical protein